MKQAKLLVSICIFALSFNVWSQNTGLQRLCSKDSPLSQDLKISFYGDSITMQGGFIHLIKKAVFESENTKKLGVIIKQHGLNGGRVPTLMEGKTPWGKLEAPMPELLKKEKADLVCIWVGVNDLAHGRKGTSPKDYFSGLVELIEMAQKNGSKVIVVPLAIMKESHPKWNSDCDKYANLAKKAASKTKSTFADMRSAFKKYHKENSIKGKSSQNLLTYDGIHMNEKGNELIAEVISEAILKALK